MNKLSKTLAIAALAFPLAMPIAGFGQEVVVQTAPPPAVVETPGPVPYEGAVWIHGYHKWDGSTYVWVPGRYDRPPRPHAHWRDGRWEHHDHGYVWVEGGWE